MMLTNWGNPTVFDDTWDFFAANKASYVIKIVAQFATMAIYTFSMVAPLIFRNREF
jgi:hypothetical protein